MKHYAIVTDVIRDEPFGVVVKEGTHNICHGFHEAGYEWADLYNTGAVKALHDGLPPGVELGDFGPLPLDTEDLLNKSPQDIPVPKTFHLVESEWLENDSLGPAIKDVGLREMPQESRQLAIDYKAHAFLVESSRSSTLLAVRLGGGGFTPDGTGFRSKTAARHEFSHLALGNSHTRRIAKDVLNGKMLILSQPYRFTDVPETDIVTKALGAKLGGNLARGGRRARRAAQIFDPNAIDADMDLMVQEGTPWERPLMRKPNLPGLPGTARSRAADRTPEARTTAARAVRDRRGLRSTRDLRGDMPDEGIDLSPAQERLIGRLRDDTLDTTLGDLYSDPTTPTSVTNAIENFTGLDKDDTDPIWNQKLSDISDTTSANILDLMEADVHGDPEKYFGQRHTRGLASVTDISNSHMKEGETSKFPGPGMIGPEMHRRLGILRDNGFHIYKGDGNNYKIVPPDRVRNAHRLQALRGREGSNPKAFDAAIEEIAAELGVRPEQLDVGNDAHWKIIGDKKRGYADLDFLGMRQGRTDARSMMSFHADSTESVLINAQKNWLRLIVGNDPDDNDVRLGDDLILGNLEDIARTGEGPLGYIPQESMRRAPRGVGGKEKLWSPVERPIGGSETQRRDFNEAARNIAIAGARRDLDAAEVMWREARDEDRKGRTPRTAALRAEASRLLQEEQDKLTDLESRWTDPTGGGRGPKSRGPDPEDFDAFWNQAREESDNHVAGLLDSVSEELGQAEPDFEKIKASHVEVLDAIDIARKKGLRSVLRDGDDDYTPDPDRWHDDPFERDRAINSSIFGDRMDGMSIDNAAEKYGVNRHEVRSREIEHLEELAGQERYNAQPNLNQRIFDDRMSGMSLEDAAKKYDVDRIEIRAREVTHSNALGGQERYNVQPNLNQRIYRDRMQGLSLDEVGRRYAMDRDEVRAREITHMGSDGRGLRSEGSKPEVDAAKPEVDAAKTAELNRRIDTLRKSKLQPWVDRVEEAKERGDDKATHSLTKELRGFQEEEAELREQLGEAMGKGRVAIGLRSQRATEDWDADWATAREESITEMTELGEQLAGELKKSKTDRKKINDLTDKISGSIEKARERGLASKGPGKPWQRPEPDSTNSFGTDGPPKDWARAKRAMDLHSNWEMYPPSDGPGYSPKSRHWGDDDVEILGRLRTGNMDAEIIRGENTGEDGFVIVGMFRDPDSAVNAAEYFDSGVSSFRTTTEAQKWLDDFDKRLANDLDPWGDDEIPAPDAVGKARGLRSQRLRQGDKVTVNHRGEDVEGTVVRFGRGGASGVGTDSYVVSIPGEQRSIWKRPDEILEGPDSERGLRSRGNDPSYEGPSPAEERGFDALMDRVDKTPIGELYDMDELSSRSNRLLDDLITEHGWDVEEDGADVGKTLAELLPGRGKIGDSRSKFLAEVESDFWDDPSKFVDLGPGPPDPYDVMVEDRMGGLRSRTRAATTERAATRRGLASRKADERTLSGIYGGDSPRQPGTADGKIWDTLSADGGMTPERTQAIADAAEALEAELLWTDTGGAQSTSLTGTAIDKAGTTYAWAMRPAIADLMGIDESDLPPPAEWRLGAMSGDIDTDIAAIEDILQNQIVRMGAGSEATVAHKRKLLDSLAVLAHMRKSGNYEALEQLHPKHRARFLDKARELDQTIPEKVKPGAAKSSIFGAVGGFDSVEAFKNEMKGRTRSRKGRTPGSKRGTRRERVGEEAQRLTGAIRGQGGPAAWWRRRQAQARRAAAGRGGRPERARVVKDPWDKDLPREEKQELKKAKKAAKKLGRLTPEKRLSRISDKRSQAAMSQRDVDTPIGGAGASTAFAGTVDDLAQWETAEGRPVVDASFVERLSFLTKIRRGEESADLKRNKGEGGGRKTSGDRRIRDEVLANASLTAGHNDLPELVDADELAELAFEADPDNPGAFRLREGFKPIQRGMGRGKAGKEGETYWQQWTRLIGRFIPGQGGEGHKAGENHAEPPVFVDGAEAPKGNLYGGYGKGALSFITPETRLIGWHKLAEINDEGDSITRVLSGAGLTDTEAPTSIKHDGDNFAAAARAALDAAQTRGGGRLKVRNRNRDRTPQDPNKPSRSLSTGSGFDISTRTSGTHDMGADWRETEFGAMIDQVLDLHDSGDLDPAQMEEAWDFLMKIPESVGDNDTYLFDTLPIFGYDAVQRHGGVISVSNRAAVVTLDHPVSGSEATAIIERLAKQGQLDQARLRELIPEYGDFR